MVTQARFVGVRVDTMDHEFEVQHGGFAERNSEEALRIARAFGERMANKAKGTKRTTRAPGGGIISTNDVMTWTLTCGTCGEQFTSFSHSRKDCYECRPS